MDIMPDSLIPEVTYIEVVNPDYLIQQSNFIFPSLYGKSLYIC